MGCVLWRCSGAPSCVNEGICDKIMCVWHLRHECNKCLYQKECVAYKRAKEKGDDRDVVE